MNQGHAQLFSTLISDIKNYDGGDPLLPWLRGIRKMKHGLPPDVLKQKLPRFLQKCVQTFKDDRRYRNDARYLQVCIRLMDFMGDPGDLLKMMDSCKIGSKRSLYYHAYALYYEKRKRYAESDEMYRLGVKNLAVPVDELQKAYEQFLSRMQAHKRRKAKMRESNSSFGCSNQGKGLGIGEATRKATNQASQCQFSKKATDSESFEGAGFAGAVSSCINLNNMGTIISLKSNQIVEDEIAVKPAESCSCSTVPADSYFEVTVDEKVVQENSQSEKKTSNSSVLSVAALETKADVSACFSSFDSGNADNTSDSGVLSSSVSHEETGLMSSSGSFLELQNLDSSKISAFCSDNTIVVSEFVGSAIVGKPEAEDACHHGLVDPTINTKEVMDDINSMFKKPLDVQVRSRRKAQQSQAEENMVKREKMEIFVDEGLENETCFPSNTAEKNSLSSVSVSNFVDSSIVGNPEAEDASYHGLEDPIIKTKEVTDNVSYKFKKSFNVQVRDTRKVQNQAEEKSGKQETLETFVDENLENGAWFPCHIADCNSLSSGSVAHGEQTIMIRRFTDEALVNDSNSPEAAYHHGLVEPTIFTKEAMNDINLMFGEPLEFEKPSRRWKQVQDPKKHSARDTFEILVDDDVGCYGAGSSSNGFGNESAFCESGCQLRCDPKFGSFDKERKQEIVKREKPSSGILTIFSDDDEEMGGSGHDKSTSSESESKLECFPCTESSRLMRTSEEDTSVCRFIGSTIVGELETENSCHHGLVDPTINLKEAMSDINSMFRKPLDFCKTNKVREHVGKKPQTSGGFTILVDENSVDSASGAPKGSGQECDWFEPTVVTKEAISEINDMFGRPLDF